MVRAAGLALRHELILVGQASACLVLIFAALAEVKSRQAEARPTRECTVPSRDFIQHVGRIAHAKERVNDEQAQAGQDGTGDRSPRFWRKHFRLDGGSSHLFQAARCICRRRFQFRRYRGRVFQVGARPHGRRVGNNYRRMDEAKRKSKQSHRRHQSRHGHGRREKRACRNPTSCVPRKIRCAACKRTTSICTSRTSTIRTRRWKKLWAPMRNFIKQGKVRAIGASNHKAERLAAALETSRKSGLPAYQTLQPNYSLIERAEYETNLEPRL